jgi:hypothetical protein
MAGIRVATRSRFAAEFTVFGAIAGGCAPLSVYPFVAAVFQNHGGALAFVACAATLGALTGPVVGWILSIGLAPESSVPAARIRGTFFGELARAIPGWFATPARRALLGATWGMLPAAFGTLLYGPWEAVFLCGIAAAVVGASYVTWLCKRYPGEDFAPRCLESGLFVVMSVWVTAVLCYLGAACILMIAMFTS